MNQLPVVAMAESWRTCRTGGMGIRAHCYSRPPLSLRAFNPDPTIAMRIHRSYRSFIVLTAFAVCFVLGCALAALLVHREDLKAAVVMPPLLYVVLALVAGAVGSTGGNGSFVTRETLELVQALVIGAPVLFAATGAAVVVALARWLRGRQAR